MTQTADYRLTEERLRNHLNGNQPAREMMCLALLPVLGPYTREHPRRPQGGPDGARDLEALHQGSQVVWGAVGFQNGGGSDTSTRNAAMKKFRDDLAAAKAENPLLTGFLFFTNVDLTPNQKAEMIQHARANQIQHFDLFDFNILRNCLDQPEGLLARLKYLNIPMTADEQASLLSKYGQQLQNAVVSRFDRLDRTLANMERFLDWQKPINRIDIYIALNKPLTAAEIANEAACVKITGLQLVNKDSYFLLRPAAEQTSPTGLVWLPSMWSETRLLLLNFNPTLSNPSILGAFYEIALDIGGIRNTLSQIADLAVSAFCTPLLRERIFKIVVDINGYEIADYPASSRLPPDNVVWANEIGEDIRNKPWVRLLDTQARNFHFRPPERSARFQELIRL